MQLPVDLKALIDEATDIGAAQATELFVSVYVDETAPAELVAHVRGAFASTAPTVRMSLSYLDSNFFPREGDDIAIIVAGDSVKVGAAAKVVRAIGVPAMVATLSPVAVSKRAEAADCAIPDGDLVAPYEADEAEGGAVEPCLFDEVAAAALDDRMGRWIVAVCREKRLAFAIAFPFMRRPLARDAVQATSLQNAGIGLVPLIPGADLPIMTLNQAKMVLQIGAAYGHAMDKSRIKELAAVIGGAYVCRTLARELIEFVPFLGFVIRTGIAYGGTAALGNAIIEYYEGGENVTGIANVAERAVEGGTKFIAEMRSFIANPKSSGVTDRAVEYVAVAREVVDKHLPTVREIAGEYASKIAETANGFASKAAARQ